MHELSIAVSIVEIAQEESERLGSKVSAVHLKLGPLSGIVKEALLFSYDVACQDTPLEGSTLVILETPPQRQRLRFHSRAIRTGSSDLVEVCESHRA